MVEVKTEGRRDRADELYAEITAVADCEHYRRCVRGIEVCNKNCDKYRSITDKGNKQ